MALDAAQVEALQNSTPTDWSRIDQDLRSRSDFNANRQAGDEKLHVRFLMKADIDQAASDAEQRPVYRDVEYVEIMIPGDKHNIVVEPVWISRADQRFPAQYAQFKAGVADQVVGTPLKLLPWATPAMIEELAFFKIRTVEQLAAIPDAHLTFMGARDMRDRAQQYLSRVQSNEALLARVNDQTAQMEKMQQMLADLQAQLAAKEAAEATGKAARK